MADDVLSQAEVESLISAMESQGSLTKSSSATAPAANRTPAKQREKIVSYDFKRPERVGKEQMRALQSLHEGFGRNFGAALSALLRSIVEVKLTSVDQLTYSEFVFSLENPTCFNLLRAEPLEGNLILDLNPSILYPIIDRLLGGAKDSGPISRRPLTEIELRLVGRITGLFLQELKHAWENVLTLKLSVDRVESNPQLVQIVPPNEVVILISFELAMGEVRGMINLCIPFNTIERVSAKLAANSWATYNRVGSTAESRASIGRRIDRSQVDLVVTLAESQITTGDLLGLRVGDIITTDKDVRTSMDVAVQGVNKFLASPGALKGSKAIRIETAPTSLPVPAPIPPAPAKAAR
ncbi:MAG: flagellar motor switch protein FliM [Pirellulaceae bacterium]